MTPRKYNLLLEGPELNFAAAFKALMDEADDFATLHHKPESATVHVEFTYKGTRRIDVWVALFTHGTGTVQDATLTVFEKEPGDKYGTKLDTNVFHNPGSKRTYELGWDPKVQTPEQAVAYVTSVLDRDDRDEYDPAPPAPSHPTKALVPA